MNLLLAARATTCAVRIAYQVYYTTFASVLQGESEIFSQKEGKWLCEQSFLTKNDLLFISLAHPKEMNQRKRVQGGPPL